MEKFFKKWYIALFLIPIVVNLFTNSFSISELLKEWQIVSIYTFVIIIGILSYDMWTVKKSLNKPKESDKKIIIELLDILDVEMFQIEICEANSGDGYKRDAIRRANDFLMQSNLLNNSLTDKKLNKLLIDFKKLLKEFLEYSANNMYHDVPGWLTIAKDSDLNFERNKKSIPKMNQQTDELFGKLDRIIVYMKNNYYYEPS